MNEPKIDTEIILCPGWEHSKGCQEERAYAELIGMEIVEYEELFG